jgi:hypothetical protein
MLSDNHAEYRRNQTRGAPRDGAAALQGIVWCGCCGRKMAVQYKGGNRYVCNSAASHGGASLCQHLRHYVAATTGAHYWLPPRPSMLPALQ